jgi:hypothetical protein
MPGRVASDVTFLPAIFEETLFAETHQQRVERAGFETRELGQLVAVLPRRRCLQQRLEHEEALFERFGTRGILETHICRAQAASAL